jgi:hypothetical protein
MEILKERIKTFISEYQKYIGTSINDIEFCIEFKNGIDVHNKKCANVPNALFFIEEYPQKEGKDVISVTLNLYSKDDERIKHFCIPKEDNKKSKDSFIFDYEERKNDLGLTKEKLVNDIDEEYKFNQ